MLCIITRYVSNKIHCVGADVYAAICSRLAIEALPKTLN